MLDTNSNTGVADRGFREADGRDPSRSTGPPFGQATPYSYLPTTGYRLPATDQPATRKTRKPKTSRYSAREHQVSGYYTDEKGRRRWRRNEEIAAKLKELHDFLVIGGYDEVHASRYPRLALAISRYPLSIETLAAEGRLEEFPGIAGAVSGIIQELIDRGTCRKFEEWSQTTPKSVLELTKIPGIGAKTVKALHTQHGISSLADLGEALGDGRLSQIRGFGARKLETIRRHIADSDARPNRRTRRAS